VANTSQVQAEIALARGITAQKQGTIVEALSYYIQASNYDSGLVEATSRMNILTANISSGNIGEDTRNDIAWRRQWIDRLQETEAFFANTVKDSQPFYIVYSTNIQQGRIDYQKETIDLNVWMGFYPDFAWANQINGVISAVKNGLQATKRASIWGIDWPTQTVSNPSPFIIQTKNSTSTVVMEIVNNEGRSIGRQTVRAPYGFEINNTIVTPLWQWEGNVSFLAVDANLITDKLTIRIASIDEIEAENAAQQKKISVMPETEWKVMLRKNSVTRRSIEGARNRQKVERVQQQKQRDREQQQREKTQLAQQQQQEKLQRAQTFFDQGRRNFDIRNYNRAITDFTEAIKLNPNLYEAYFQRARVYSELNRYDRAIADYTQVIQLLPNDWGAYNNRGLAYHKKGDYDRAITDYNQAIQMNPNNAAGYHNRGDVYFDKKNWRMAIADYTEAIRINPNYALSYNNRGVAYRNIGEENRAIADFTDALRLNPHSALYRYNHQ
jgi:tetratricopeptide (TPR) repeat protein